MAKYHHSQIWHWDLCSTGNEQTGNLELLFFHTSQINFIAIIYQTNKGWSTDTWNKEMVYSDRKWQGMLCLSILLHPTVKPLLSVGSNFGDASEIKDTGYLH